MSINFGSFFNNFQNSMFNANFNSLGLSNSIATTNQTADTQQTNQSLLNVLPKTNAQINSTFKELANLNEQQTNTMVKDLLKFPKQFEQMIKLLSTLPQAKTSQTNGFLLSSSLNLSQISEFLQNSSKDAMSNLYKLLADFNHLGVSLKQEQITHLHKIISLISSSSVSNTQSLKTIMLMYLPWLPLNNPDAFKFDISDSNNNNDLALGIDSVSILMSTKNYGNLKAQIIKTESDGIKIELVTSESFPIKDLTEFMKKESKNHNININFDITQKSTFNKKKIENIETQVSLNTSPGVNPFLLLISNALINNVHTIDIKESKRWQEKEIIENGKS